ncbi:class I adenylate-forming enzyme family protein [Pseudonocardia alaniniphila]|uniref:Acyl--CoA ligase n=1 Tax=Pseudonocardia alaniniphila TaxID=75291 RepID=A0ABS9TT97_9PSEU|nr:class I adenylate-forming enzyme family protein [Pseudonocardia alaniniphila]MCH6171754.1 acyl--CoA ligase [Pseudonocardia alaniniphila]
MERRQVSQQSLDMVSNLSHGHSEIPARITTGDYLLGHPVGALGGFTLSEVFSAAVEADPDKEATTAGERYWRWRQWWRRSETLASRLQDRGVEPGHVVAAQLPSSWEFLTLHTAAASVGAALLPVRHAYGHGDVRALIDRVRPAVVVDTQTWQGLSAAGAGRRPDEVVVSPDAPFMLLPSSGTSAGRPKICMDSHDGLLSNAASVLAESSMTGKDVVTSASPLTDLFGLPSIHLSLFTRNRQDPFAEWDFPRFFELAEKAATTVLFAVSALSDILSGVAGRPGFTLREVRASGSSVPTSLVTRTQQELGAQMIVQWGMSELGAGAFTRPDETAETLSSTVGTPVREAEARAIERELQFRSPSLFRGYWGEPETTDAAITDDGWLRTGDTVNIDPDGRTIYLGRSAELIDVDGRKFNAREIEDLLEHLGPVALVGRPDPRLGEYPCLVVERPGIDLMEVVRQLREAGFAEYKIPAELVTVGRIPLTPTGKISRHGVTALIGRTAAPDQPWTGGPRAGRPHGRGVSLPAGGARVRGRGTRQRGSARSGQHLRQPRDGLRHGREVAQHPARGGRHAFARDTPVQLPDPDHIRQRQLTGIRWKL